jgi:hypothetical protein
MKDTIPRLNITIVAWRNFLLWVQVPMDWSLVFMANLSSKLSVLTPTKTEQYRTCGCKPFKLYSFKRPKYRGTSHKRNSSILFSNAVGNVCCWRLVSFFVIYTLKDLFYCLIPFSSSFIERNLPSARLFWEKCILLESFACYFTIQKKTRDLSLTDKINKENAHLPCFCSTIKKMSKLFCAVCPLVWEKYFIEVVF